MPGLVYPFLIFSAVYLFLAAVVTWLLIRHIRSVDRDYPSALDALPSGPAKTGTPHA
jgi:cytochrome bd-type quinol oxidase subunit 1